jgi:hypothetical protein
MEHLFSHSYLWLDASEEREDLNEEGTDLLQMLRNDRGPLYGIMRRMGYHLDKYNAARSHQFDELKAIGGMFHLVHIMNVKSTLANLVEF